MVSARGGAIGLALAMALIPTPARGQSTTVQPAAEAEDVLLTGEVEADVSAPDEGSAAVTPGDHPLSGGLRMDIGTWGPRRSYVVRTVTTLLGITFESEHGNGEKAAKYVSVAGQLQAIGYFWDGARRFATSGPCATTPRPSLRGRWM